MRTLILSLSLVFVLFACGKEYHVSPEGDDSNSGKKSQPFKTIMAAAEMAQAGDVITVHQGVYREEIDPPRGGTSDNKRIVYRAAEGDTVIIKGSEIIKDWKKAQFDTWVVEIPNSYFGEFNPYQDEINGDWFNPKGRKHHTGAVYLYGHWLEEAASVNFLKSQAYNKLYWFAESDEDPDGVTRIWAQFKGVDPNEVDVEINVRQTVFYPRNRGINYITVKGFTLEQAATPWAPPTAEQVGLIGTHWSKGWIIENNKIQYSSCVGLTLGKHGDEFDNTSANSAEGYVKTIERGLEQAWSGENIGHHIVRNNEIQFCEQAGIVGSLGPIFCKINNNEIHNIHIRRLFTGAEMAGIKLHGAVDTEIRKNHIYNCSRGIWLDWMAQGTRVTQNLLHNNGPSEDLFLEVNHGPTMVDNNIMLSDISLLVNSQGAAYVHNLMTGGIRVASGERRLTPHLVEHGTEMAGLAPNQSGDERFYNNIFAGSADLSAYDNAVLTVWMEGNVFLERAKPGKAEESPLVIQDYNPEISLSNEEEGWYLKINVDESWATQKERQIITSDVLGKVSVPDLPYVLPDGSPYKFNSDYFDNTRSKNYVFPGPFILIEAEKDSIRVW